MWSQIKYSIAFLMGILTLFLLQNAEACSCVLWKNNINTLCVRSLNLFIDDQSAIVKFPRGLVCQEDAGHNSIKWKSKYGSL